MEIEFEEVMAEVDETIASMNKTIDNAKTLNEGWECISKSIEDAIRKRNT